MSHDVAYRLTDNESWRKFIIFATILTAMFFIPAGYLLLKKGLIYFLIYLTLPGVVILISMPRLSFYLFIGINFIYMPYMLGGIAVHLWDLAAMIMFASCAIAWLYQGKAKIDKTTLDYPFIFLILITLVSGIFADQPRMSVIPIGRIIIIYIAFRTLYFLSGLIGAANMVKAFLYIHFAIASYYSILFILAKGSTRIFGFSGIAYETISMIGVPAALAFAIWSEKGRDRLIYTLIFAVTALATIATQSRGPMLTIAIASPVLLYYSWRKSKTDNTEKYIYVRAYIRRFLYIITPLLIIGLVGSGIFLQVAERFDEMSEGAAKGTIMLRASLWKAALQGFMLDPLTGIGIGNFMNIDNILPQLKFDPVRYYIKNMSIHNVFLQYLCETGIFGAIAISSLGFIAFRTGYRTLRASVKKTDMPVVAFAFISVFILFITIFYMRAWTWGQEGYIFAFFLAINARLYKRFVVEIK